MSALRLLGWVAHVAFFAAWIQVALIMERQLHDEPRPGAASSSFVAHEAAPEAARGGGPDASPDASTAAVPGSGRVKTSARNARDLKARAG